MLLLAGTAINNPNLLEDGYVLLHGRKKRYKLMSSGDKLLVLKSRMFGVLHTESQLSGIVS